MEKKWCSNSRYQRAQKYFVNQWWFSFVFQLQPLHLMLNLFLI